MTQLDSLPLGKIHDEPMKAYHAADAVSSSKLKVFRASPLLFFKTYVLKSITDEEGEEEKNSLSLGGALASLMEGGMSTLLRDYSINRKYLNWRTDESKNWRDFELAQGKKILSPEQLGVVRAMQDSILSHPDAAVLMTEGEPEVTFRLKLARFHVQARPDKWHPAGLTLSDGIQTGPLITELKTTASLDDSAFTCFQRQFGDLGYYRQAALYREVVAMVEGLEVLPAIRYVVVENQEPFRTAVFWPDPTALNLGRAEIMHDISNLCACYDSGVWPGFPGGVQPLALNRWQMKQKLAALEGVSRLALT